MFKKESDQIYSADVHAPVPIQELESLVLEYQRQNKIPHKVFEIHASDQDELQFFQRVFADDKKADNAESTELPGSQTSSVLKNTHLQKFSNRKKQGPHNPDLEDFKIELVADKEAPEEEESNQQNLKSANTVLSQIADYDMFTEVPPSDDRRMKTSALGATNK